MDAGEFVGGREAQSGHLSCLHEHYSHSESDQDIWRKGWSPGTSDQTPIAPIASTSWALKAVPLSENTHCFLDLLPSVSLRFAFAQAGSLGLEGSASSSPC